MQLHIITFLFTLLSLSVSTLAADCGNSWLGNPSSGLMGQFWRSREALCQCIGRGGSNASCRVTNSLYRFEIFDDRPSTQLCWDATENILNQCIKNGEFL